MALMNSLAPADVGLTALVLVVAYVLVGSIINYRKLRQFTGPPLAGFSRAYLFFQSVRKRLYASEIDALQRYGSPARIGPNLLVTDDVDLLRHISAPRSHWRRSGWYEAMKFDSRQDSVFSTTDESVHTQLRTTMIGAYSGRDFPTLESDMDSQLLDFLDLIATTYNGVTMDFAKTAHYFTLDVLSTIAFAKTFGNVKANKDIYDYVGTTRDFAQIIELSNQHAFFRWIAASSIAQWLLAPKMTDKQGIGPMLNISKEATAARFGPDPVKKQDMLGYMVKKGMPQLQCEAEATIQLVAGSDSTTGVMRTTLFMLLSNPVVYSKLRNEIDEAADSSKITRPVITYEEAKNLPYLQACIWEGLRMYPPLFGLASKVAPPEGETINGVFFPGGTEVAACFEAICRRKDIFGKDPHIFRPDRWIEADETTRATYKRTVDTIFGSGRYSCLGKHIAMIELTKTLAELVRNFDWAYADPMRGVDELVHGMRIQSNMNVIAWPRQVYKARTDMESSE